MKMSYKELLQHSFEVESKPRYGIASCPTRLEFLSNYIFEFTTYDSEMDILFGKKAVEVCDAITNGTTQEYIENAENYRWFIMMCNTNFFEGRLNWGTSIRGAWWDHRFGDNCHEIDSTGLWDGEKQLVSDNKLKFTNDEWKEFMLDVIAFAEPEMSN